MTRFAPARTLDYGQNLLHRKGLPIRTKIIELHMAWLEGGTPVIVDALCDVHYGTWPVIRSADEVFLPIGDSGIHR
jgi:hypothetical protein